MRKIIHLTISIIPFLLNGCTQRLIDFTTISSKNVTMKLPPTSKGNRVNGEHYVTVFLGIPFGTPNLKEATDKAIENAGSGYDALIDGVVYVKRKWYLLFGKLGYEIEGTPIKTADIQNNELTRSQPALPAPIQSSYPFDLLVMRDGSQIQAIISEVNDREIVYKRAENPTGPMYRSLKTNMNYVRYSNSGEIERFTTSPR